MISALLLTASVVNSPVFAQATPEETSQVETFVFDVCKPTLRGHKGERLGSMTLTREVLGNGTEVITEKWNTKVIPTTTGRPVVGQFVPASLFPLKMSAFRQSKRKGETLIGYSGKTVVDQKTHYSFSMSKNGRQVVLTTASIGKSRKGLAVSANQKTGPEALWHFLTSPKKSGQKETFHVVAENLGNPMVGVKNRECAWTTKSTNVKTASGKKIPGYFVSSKSRWQSIHSGYVHGYFDRQGRVVSVIAVASKAESLELWPRSRPSDVVTQTAAANASN